MATAASSRATFLGVPSVTVIVVLSALGIFFGMAEVVPLFVWNEQAYGYYWPHRVPLILHVVGGLVALLAGVFQLWSGLNRRAMGAHPVTGKLYVGGIVIGTAGAIVLSFTSAVYGFAWGVALFVLAIAWITVTGIAVHCIRRRNVRAHQEWMTRSYILTFAFVTFRIFLDYLPYEALWNISRADMANAIIWPVWVVPLIGYQIYLQYRRIRASPGLTSE